MALESYLKGRRGKGMRRGCEKVKESSGGGRRRGVIVWTTVNETTKHA